MSLSFPSDLETELVILKDHRRDAVFADQNGDVDITSRVSGIEYYDGSPQTLIIQLNNRDGYFTAGDNGPLLTHWDRLYVELKDRDGNKIDDVFHIKDIKPERIKGVGITVQIICLHESSNRYTALIAKPNRRSSGFASFKDALLQLNDNRGEKDPEIVIPDELDYTKKIGIFLDPTTYNDYIFEMKKLSKIVEVIVQKESQPIEAGGSLEFFFFRFKSLYDHSTGLGLGKIAPQMIPQGYVVNDTNDGWTNTPKITLEYKDPDEAPSTVISSKGHLESEKATHIILVGDHNAGTVPPDYSEFQGKKDQFRLAASWSPDFEYRKDSLVSYRGATYRATIDIPKGVTPSVSAPGNVWQTQTFNPTKSYSPLTKPKYFLQFLYGYINFNDSSKTVGILDHNCVIQHSTFNRIFVHAKITPADYFIDVEDNNQGSILLADDMLMPDGNPAHNTTVLCIGDIPEADDDDGKPFTNNILRYIRPEENPEEKGRWTVLMEREDDLEIIVRREGETYIWNPLRGIAIVNTSGQIITGVRDTDTGPAWKLGTYFFVHDIPNLGSTVSFRANKHSNAVHPIARDSSTGGLKIGSEKISPDDNTTSGNATFVEFDGSENSAIAGINFGFPWPSSKFSTTALGSISRIGEQITTEAYDFLNMHRTQDGKRKHFGEQIRGLFPIHGFGFFEHLFVGRHRNELETIISTFGNLIDNIIGTAAGSSDSFGNINDLAFPEGDYKKEIFLVDENYNIVTMEYVHEHNNVQLSHIVDRATAKKYRAVLGTSQFTLAKQPEILNRFDWRRVVYGGIITKDSFDADGRYLVDRPELQQGWNRFWLANVIRFSIDAFRLTKPLVVSNIKDDAPPERNIHDLIREDKTILSIAQAQNYVDSLEPVLGFRKTTYMIEADDRQNIKWGDVVYYTDKQLLAHTTVTDGKQHTIKGTVIYVNHKITKPKFGVGGRTRTIEIATRFYPQNI